MDENYELILGNKNTSSWSMRPWLVLTHFGIPFSETMIQLRRPKTRANILRHSPSGKVPALKAGALVVWDSLAIIEFLAERHPSAAIWPQDGQARAIARCAAAEMHSGFPALRKKCPMDFARILGFPEVSKNVVADMKRIVSIWLDCRKRLGGGGDFLFGSFCAADAMFAPVVSRFVTYEVDLARFGDDGVAAQYLHSIMSLPAVRSWADAARLEI